MRFGSGVELLRAHVSCSSLGPHYKLLLLAGQLISSALNIVLVHSSASSQRAHRPAPDDGASNTLRPSYPYHSASLVLIAELLKLLICATAVAYLALLSPDASQRAATRKHLALALRSRRTALFALPAAIYAIENNLRFRVLRELNSPVTWVVWSHFEIPIVALLSWALLGRRLTPLQLVSILLLLDGVLSSQIAACEAEHHQRCTRLADFPLEALASVLLAAALSGGAGIASEFLLKEEPSTSIFLQNAQLYFFGSLCNAALLLRAAPAALAQGRILDGVDATAWAIIATMAAQGLCVAAVVKKLSNLAKVYAAACGIFLTAFISAASGGTELSLPVALAAVQVAVAVALFQWERIFPGFPPGGYPKAPAAPPLEGHMSRPRERLDRDGSEGRRKDPAAYPPDQGGVGAPLEGTIQIGGSGGYVGYVGEASGRGGGEQSASRPSPNSGTIGGSAGSGWIATAEERAAGGGGVRAGQAAVTHQDTAAVAVSLPLLIYR